MGIMNKLRKRIRDRLARRWLGEERPAYGHPHDPAVLDVLADLIVAHLFRPGMDNNIVRLFDRPGNPDDNGPPSEWTELSAVVFTQLSERARFTRGKDVDPMTMEQDVDSMTMEMNELAERVAGRIAGVALVDAKMAAAVRQLIDEWAEHDQAPQTKGGGG